MDCHAVDGSVSFSRGSRLLGTLRGFIVSADIIIGLVDFPFGYRSLSFLGSDRLQALSLSICLSVTGVGVNISDALPFWRRTLLGSSERISPSSIGSRRRFLRRRALLGGLGRFITSCGSSTTLLGCLGGSDRVPRDGFLGFLDLSAEEHKDKEALMENWG